MICLLHVIHLIVFCRASLPSDFYQPTSGVYFERWTSISYYNMSAFNSIPNYPDCPSFISHSSTFAYSELYPGKHQYGRFRASFVSTQTGVHKFFAILNNEAQIYIELNPTGLKKILDISSFTTDNWSAKIWCEDVKLLTGFRYEIIVYHYGNGAKPDFFRLGVKLPDGKEVKPITSAYLRRSMEYYAWNGLLVQKYEDFQFPASKEDYTLAKAYNMNPSYPSNATSHMCKSSLYDTPGDYYDNYALKYMGYMSVPESANYTFRMFCPSLCQMNMTKSGSNSVLGYYNDVWRLYFIEMNAGALTNGTLYPVTVFFCTSWGGDYLQMSYQRASLNYSTSWNRRLRNLLPAETAKDIPLPVPAMINSTTISVTLLSPPYLPPRDNWTYAQASEILYHRSGVEETAKKLTMSGALPKTVYATGLQKYTDYVFYAHHFGKINGENKNIITRYSAVVKTDEDVSESAPINLITKKRSSTSINVTWGELSNTSLWNGIGIGYEVQYRLKNANSGNWISVLISGTSNRQYIATGLLKYEFYEFKVAGITSKGSGVFSDIKEDRTMEDVPNGSPRSVQGGVVNLTAIYVTWNVIPKQSQNGVILNYNVAYKQNDSSQGWKVISTDSKTFRAEIGNLQYNKIYEVKVAGRTSIGRGPYSVPISIRTDVYGEFYTEMKYTDTSLKNHMVKYKQVESLTECFRQCLKCDMEDGCACSSINFSHFQIDSKNECEVNDASHLDYIADFVTRYGFQYYERHN